MPYIKKRLRGGGTYVLSNEPTFPTKGYLLNLEETKCYDYEGKPVTTSGLSQASDGKIIIETNATKYCDLYFAKDDDVPEVTTFSITGSKENNETLNGGYTHKTNVTYSISWDATDVVSYCIGTNKDNCDGIWVDVSGVTSINPTEPVLDNIEGKKTRYAFIKDKANNISVGKEASITLDLNDPTVSNVTYKSKDTNSITVNVTGSDGTTGSGVVKYECKATTQDAWFTQVGDTCKVTGLNDGTEYTIEGRVTDASGRVSTNSVSTNQSTEPAYSCSAGEELVQDTQRGSSSGGYICKASASSKGWYNTTTYWTCNEIDGSQYDSRESAISGCKFAIKASCSSVKETWYGRTSYIDDYMYWGHTAEEAWFNYYRAGWRASECYYSSAGNHYWCALEDENGDGYATYGYSSMSECSSSCTGVNFMEKLWNVRKCSISDYMADSSTKCAEHCGTPGTVEQRTEKIYYCDNSSGWSSFSGSESSLECYKAAIKS